MDAPGPFDVVVSLAGHDTGKYFMVVGTREGRLLLCDGKSRRLRSPKSKSPRHVRLAAVGREAPGSDSQIRKTLALTAQSAAAKEVIRLGER